MASAIDLTVVIPAYQAQDFIAKAIDSCRAAGIDRIVVVDDGSKDDTATVAERLGCTVIRQENSGAAAARRRGMATVTTDFVILLDADDQLEPAGVAASLMHLRRDPQLIAAMGSSVHVGANGQERCVPPWLEPVNTFSLLQRGHSPGPPAAIAWRTSALREVVSDDEQAIWPRYAEDYEFLLRGARLGRIASHTSVACRYAADGGKSSLNPERSLRDAERIRAHYARLEGMSIRARSQRQLKALVAMRTASGQSGVGRAALLLRAAILDPGAMSRRAARHASRLRAGSGENQVPARPTRHPNDFGWSSFGDTVRRDLRANPRDPKAQIALVLFRVTQLAMGSRNTPRVWSIPLVVAYRVATEWVFGFELRPKTSVGPGLSIYHGFGLVVNDHTKLGSNVKLRNGVTIGHRSPGGGAPTIGDDVEIGAGAAIIGPVSIGEGAVVGAGAVVVGDVAPGETVVGNPARPTTRPRS